MSIATVTNSLKNLLNTATPAQLATYLAILRAGDVLREMPVWLRRCNPNGAVTNPYIVAGQSCAETIIQVSGATGPNLSPGANLLGQLPDDAKCGYILRAVAMAGTGTPTTAELVVDSASTNATSFATGGTGPAAGHIGFSPSGDIVTNSTDAWTSVDVLYVPEQVDVIEVQLSPASAVVTLPTGLFNYNQGSSGGTLTTVPGTVLLMEAEILTGTVTGKCAILPLSNAAPGATKQANLNLAKSQVLFKVSDGPTLVRLKLGVCRSLVTQNPQVSTPYVPNQALEAISPVF